MKITQDLIDSLHDGDRVSLKHRDWKYPIEGKMFCRADGGALEIGGFAFTEGSLRILGELWDLEVLERAPRFYVNVDRAPVPGDVCRLDVPADAEGTNSTTTWSFRVDGQWWPTRSHLRPTIGGDFGIRQPVLIVDGETGLPVMPESVQAELGRLRAVADL